MSEPIWRLITFLWCKDCGIFGGHETTLPSGYTWRDLESGIYYKKCMRCQKIAEVKPALDRTKT